MDYASQMQGTGTYNVAPPDWMSFREVDSTFGRQAGPSDVCPGYATGRQTCILRPVLYCNSFCSDELLAYSPGGGLLNNTYTSFCSKNIFFVLSARAS